MLERFFRDYFWTTTLLFLGVSGYFSSNILSSWVALRFAASEVTILERKLTEEETTFFKKNSSVYIMNKANLFDEKNENLNPKEEVKTKEEKKPDQETKEHCDPKGSYKPSKLPLQLKGTMVADDSNYSAAALWDSKQNKTFVVQVNETVLGVQICAITPKIVKIDRGKGNLEYFELGAKAGNSTGFGARRKLYNHYMKLRKTNLDLTNIRKQGKDTYSLSRDFLNKMTGRLDILASQAAIIPYFEKGKPVGFRIRNIRKDSLYTKLGLGENDVVRKINGYDLSSPQKALEAFHNLVHAKHLNVDLLRKGKAQSMNYNVRD